VQTATLAVGTDGTVFVGGLIPELLGVAVIAAFSDMGDHAAYAWDPAWVELRDNAQFTLGIALRENAGGTTIVFASTANLGTALFNAKTEGTLYALDPSDGRILGSYDPSDDVPEAVGGINSPAIDAAGRVFFGVRGRYGANPINGHYFGVTFDPTTGVFSRMWSYEVDGYVEWSHPAIGPDGGIYVGSSENEDTDQIRTVTYDEGVIPEGSSPLFYALRGPQGVRAEPAPPIPEAAYAIAAYPNPFANEVAIRIDPGSGEVPEVEIMDLVGRVVRTFALPNNGSGVRTIRWDGRTNAGMDAAPGVYLVRAVGSRTPGGRSFIHVEKLVKLARRNAP
jgi:hypothetical protein